MKTPTYRSLIKKDIPKIIMLMEKVKAPIAGMQTREMYECFCNYVVDDKKVVFLVAEVEKMIVGFSITIIDYRLFWKKFFAIHPNILFKTIFKKTKFIFIKNSLSQHSTKSIDISKYLSENLNDRSWKDSSPLIAKVLYLAVLENFRNQGIGKGLQKHRYQLLIKMGVKRIDSKINQKNIAPIKIAYGEGRKIVMEKNGMLFTTKDL